MIKRKTAESIHQLLIKKFGGTDGIRDAQLLESALQRPFQTFENIHLYNTPIEKASALIESIITNHPFLDGNKRTGYVLMRLLLIENKVDIQASEEEKFEFVIAIASGGKKYSDIVEWLKIHVY